MWLCVRVHVINHVRLFATPWIVTRQTPLSIECSKKEYWSGLPFCPPGDLLDPVIKVYLLCFLHWQAGSLPLSHLGSPSIWLTSWQFGARPPEPIKIIVLGLADYAFKNTREGMVWKDLMRLNLYLKLILSTDTDCNDLNTHTHTHTHTHQQTLGKGENLISRVSTLFDFLKHLLLHTPSEGQELDSSSVGFWLRASGGQWPGSRVVVIIRLNWGQRLHFFFFFLPHCAAWEILVPQPGNEPAAPALQGQGLYHWTAMKVSHLI